VTNTACLVSAVERLVMALFKNTWLLGRALAQRGAAAAVALSEATPQRAAALPHLDPANYSRHALHSPECNWVEKNCYIDIWIELIHSLKQEPLAMLAFTVAVDFEGDQWTFFKPPHEDLKALYGIDVQELYVWRPLIEHAVEHLRDGKFISTEADAYWLPDTAGNRLPPTAHQKHDRPQ